MKHVSPGKILASILIIFGGLWLYRYITTPPPGYEIEDQGRKHVTAAEVESTVYKSNPPVSGPHVETWVKAGVYSEPQAKGELLHSLEHGYVNIYYTCDTPCTTLVDELSNLARKKRIYKLIVVPNPEIKNRIVLAAWDHLDVLDSYDESRIVSFIDYYRDHGPEQTME